LGADDYLTKPFTSAELIETVQARLARQDAIASPYKTEMKRAAENLNHLAFYDPLTNLPNLILLHQRLRELLNEAQNSSEDIIAVMRIHIAPLHTPLNPDQPLDDGLVQQVATRLNQFLSSQESPTDYLIGRLSNNEFGVVVSKALVVEDILSKLQLLLNILSPPYEQAHRLRTLSLRVGLAMHPEHSTTPSGLLQNAQIAMESCIEEQNAVFCVYTPELGEAYIQRQELQQDIIHAIEQGQMSLYYQPQINLVSERMVGVEALLRWQHPTQGLILPDIFIPIAERANLLPTLGDWVLKQACAQVQAWRSLTLIPLQVSVNLWAQQIQSKNFTEVVLQAIRDTKLDPKQLVLDISESCLMSLDFEAIAQILDDLSSAGVQIAIDGFGMRCMPLKHLKRLPVDQLKLDKSFIDGIAEDDEEAILTETVIAMAQNLKLKVVAKGIEAEDQLTALKKHGCHIMQGYLYSPPLPANEFETWLDKGNSSQFLTQK
ncbi:MAG: EAL domain-containing protein, partial [Elainellaceae cyanobacterium]